MFAFTCMSVCLSVYMRHEYAGARGGQKRVLSAPELELQEVGSCRVVAGAGAKVLAGLASGLFL